MGTARRGPLAVASVFAVLLTGGLVSVSRQPAACLRLIVASSQEKSTLLTQIAALDANLIEVLHERISETLSLDEVEVALQLELRGEDHRERLLAGLVANGYSYTLN